MDVQFADSFTKSLKRLMWHESKVYKFYALFRYKLPYFFKNIWKFRKELWLHRWWDYSFTLRMLYRSIEIMEKEMSINGIEADETREPKVKKMRRAMELLQHKLDDDYISRAEEVYGKREINFGFEKMENGNYRLVDEETPEEKEHWKKVFEYSRKLEEKEWKELWSIFKGRNGKFDGSDLRGWWD